MPFRKFGQHVDCNGRSACPEGCRGKTRAKTVCVMEVWNLYRRVAYLPSCMRVASDNRKKVVLLGENVRFSVIGGKHVSCIEHLDAVQRAHDAIQGFTRERVRAQTTEGMINTDYSTLRMDAINGLFNGQPVGNPLLKKVPDDLAFRGQNFLPNNHAHGMPCLLCLQRARNGAVIGNGNHADPPSPRRPLHIGNAEYAVGRKPSMTMEFNAYP